jgi:hypothetical protein
MKEPKLVKSTMDSQIAELAKKADQSVLALWATDCTERVLHYFESKYPDDGRPRKAIEACRGWVRGEQKVSDVRTLALQAHAAARNARSDPSAEAAARSAGQAAATAHVPAHSTAAAVYAASAVRDASEKSESKNAMEAERKWQYRHLVDLLNDGRKQGNR